MPAQDPVTANIALVDDFFRDIMNNANPGALTELLSSNFVLHHSALPGGQGGAADVVKLMTMFRAAFPDLHYDIDDHVAQDDRVTTRWTATGTHSGTFMGIPPTGKRVSVAGTDVFRIAAAYLAESWVCSDMLGLLQQLGAFAPPAAAPTPAARSVA